MAYDVQATYRVEMQPDRDGWIVRLPDLAYPQIWCLTRAEVPDRVRRIVRNTLRAGNDDFDLAITERPRLLQS